MNPPTFEDWLAIAFPWLTTTSPDATRMREAWEAGRDGREWISDPPSWSRDAKNERTAWEDGAKHHRRTDDDLAV
jgi:hypothetical protein